MSEVLKLNPAPVDDGRQGVIRPDGTYVPRETPINYDSFMNQAVDDVAYKSVNPDVDSKSQAELTPHHSNKASEPRLEDEVNQLIGEEWDYTHAYANKAKDDWLAEQKLAYNTQVKYLELLGFRSQDKNASIEERQIWANEFTKLSIEIYGAPDPDVAKIIDAGEGEKIIEKYQPVFDAVRKYYESQFNNVLTLPGMEKYDDKVSIEEISETFMSGLEQLKQIDPKWNDWRVVMVDGTDISCDTSSKRLKVGNKRISKRVPKTINSLFVHEMLVHGLRAVNAEGIGMDSALPRYVMAEEGLAKVAEEAFLVDNKSILASMDNYADIAYALGMIDGNKHTRKDIIARKIERRKREGEEITEKVIKQSELGAARIFRGTPGSDEVSGVFTKDVSYFGGFVPIASFIESGLEKGQNVDEIMEYLLSAKFDPNNPEHAEFIGSKLNERYLPKPPTEIDIQPKK